MGVHAHVTLENVNGLVHRLLVFGVVERSSSGLGAFFLVEELVVIVLHDLDGFLGVVGLVSLDLRLLKASS